MTSHHNYLLREEKPKIINNQAFNPAGTAPGSQVVGVQGASKGRELARQRRWP